MVVFNTQGSYASPSGPSATLPSGTQLTMQPVGPWIATARFELGYARTPRFWLITTDQAPTAIPQGHLSVTTGRTFLLGWRGVDGGQDSMETPNPDTSPPRPSMLQKGETPEVPRADVISYNHCDTNNDLATRDLQP